MATNKLELWENTTYFPIGTHWNLLTFRHDLGFAKTPDIKQKKNAIQNFLCYILWQFSKVKRRLEKILWCGLLMYLEERYEIH